MALDDIVFDLENPIEATRIRAVVRLVRSSDIRSISYLERVAENDESAQIRYLARKGLKLLKDKALDDERRRIEVEYLTGDMEQTIDALVSSHDQDDRRRGFRLAAHLHDSALFPVLQNAYLREESTFLKPMMLNAMIAVGEERARNHVIDALDSQEHRLRACAVEAAGLLKDSELLDRVVPLLQDEDNRVAANAILALKDYGSIQVLELLKEMLSSADVNRRDSAAFALAEIGWEEALPLLVQASRDERKTVRIKAVRGLERLAATGHTEARDVLQKVSVDDEEGLADYFTLALTDPAVKYLAHEDFNVRLSAVKETVRTGDKTRLPALKEALKRERDTFVKSALVRAIGELGGEDDCEAVLPFLVDRESRVRANAVEAIGLIGEHERLRSLLPSLQDNNNRVRANAVVALKDEYPQQAIEALRAMAINQDVRMKLSAAYACFEMGTGEAIKILGTLGRDKDLRVAEKAHSSLEILKDQGNTDAVKMIQVIDREHDELSSIDSFVAFDDGSIIQLTPPPDTVGDDDLLEQSAPGISSLSISSRIGIKTEIDLRALEQEDGSQKPESRGETGLPSTTDPADSSAWESHPAAKPLKDTKEKYVVLGEVGRGGMGVILNAVDTDIRREVAMKVITGKRKASRQYTERFVEEAQVQGQLEHPNICPVHELGIDGDGRIFFTMKMVRGSSLAATIKRSRKDPGSSDAHRLTETLNMFLKILDGIAFAHSRGVIHRDLKPDNIMVGDFGEVYVMDWGLAKIVGVEDDRCVGLVITDRVEDTDVMKTMSGSVVGTPSYMPPEQAKGAVEDMDECSDIYSLGALLYELLTLKPPFSGRTPWEILRKVNNRPPMPPSQRAPERHIPPELDAVMMKCLEKRRENRYQNVQELKREIELFLSGRPIEAIDYSLWQIFRKWVDRNRILAASSLIVVMVIIIAASVYQVNMSKAMNTIKEERDRAEKQRQLAVKQEEEAQKQRDIAREEKTRAQEQRAKAERNMLTSLLNQGRLLEARKEHGEAVKILQDVRERMKNTGQNLFPYIDLLIWKSKYCGSGYREVVHVLKEHATPIRAMVCSPVVGLIAAGEENGTILLWDSETREIRSELKGHLGVVNQIAFDSSGTMLASASDDRTIRIWSTETGQELATLHGHTNPVMTVAFSPDDATIASGSTDCSLRLWSVEKKTCIQSVKLQGKRILALAFNPRGKSLIVGEEESVVLWETGTFTRIRKLYEHRDSITHLTFSSDGRLLASASEDTLIGLYDMTLHRELAILESHGEDVESLAFSPDGRLLVSGSQDKTIKLWDIEKKKEISSFREHDGHVYAVSFSPDGKVLATGSEDRTIKLWDMEAKDEIFTYQHIWFFFQSLALSPDGKLLAAGSNNTTITLWDMEKMTPVGMLVGHFGHVASLSFSPDGKVLASGSKTARIMLWDMEKKVSTATLTGHNADVVSLDFTPDGSRLISGSKDWTVRIWDVKSRTCKASLGGVRGVKQFSAISPDGHTLACIGKDFTVILWDISTSQQVHLLHGNTAVVESLAFNADGTLVAASSEDNTVRLWSVATGELTATLEHDGNVNALSFSRDGRLLATGGGDAAVRLWAVDTGESIVALKAHEMDITSLKFSPKGDVLVSASKDKTVKFWNFGDVLKPRNFSHSSETGNVSLER